MPTQDRPVQSGDGQPFYLDLPPTQDNHGYEITNERARDVGRGVLLGLKQYHGKLVQRGVTKEAMCLEDWIKEVEEAQNR